MEIGNRIFCVAFLGDKVFDFIYVPIAEQKQAVGIAVRRDLRADLLIIAFDIFRKIIMDHKTDIRLIDSHSKSNGGHHDLYIIPDKQFLIFHTRHIRQACMIGPDRISFTGQDTAQVIHLLSGEAVDDSGLILEIVNKSKRLVSGESFCVTRMFRLSRLKLPINSPMIRNSDFFEYPPVHEV